jgi:hypothetical protein
MRAFPIRAFTLLSIAVLVPSLAPPAGAEEEITVGRSAAGQIKVDLELAQPLPLDPSVFPGITGYATGELGLHSTILDFPTNDFFQLSPAGDFRLILLAKDPGMEVWNDTGSGFMGIGESFFVGPAPFDTHPVWNLVAGTAGNTYSLTLKLHDLNGVYTDSDPFVLSFTPRPVAPGPGPYRIDIAPVDPAHARLLWSTNAVGWALESAGSATALNWDVVTNLPGITDTNFSLDIPTSDATRFYRLHRP